MTELVRPALFLLGDPIPPFTAATNLGHEVQLQSTAGRLVILAFLGPLSLELARAFFADLRRLANDLDPETHLLACVLTDTGGADIASLDRSLLVFDDRGAAISTAYGALGAAPGTGQPILWPHALILDHGLRVLRIIPFQPSFSCGRAIEAALHDLEQRGLGARARRIAPVLIAPRIFEPELCRHLVAIFADDLASESGFMVERHGVTRSEVNHAIKRRKDLYIADPSVRDAIRRHVAVRLAPEMERAFQYRPTRMDRYIIACYDATTGGYFRPHRDNVSKGTEHRRFAITINLNPDEYQGGDLRFPEFSQCSYRAPAGAAIVFSCSLLHEVTPIASGRRFAFLAFLYGEDDASLRERNNAYLSQGEYRYERGSDQLF